MAGLTVVIALVGAAVAFISGPVCSLVTYFMVNFYYPRELTLPLGTVEFSAGRIVILGTLANALLRGGQWRRFKFEALDFWILVQFILMSLALMANVEASRVLLGRGGVIFDCLLPYFAMRIIISDRDKLVRFLKWTTAGLVPLALAGIYEAKTGHNLYSPLAPYMSWGLAGDTADPQYMRHGLYRASTSLGNYILLGLLFAAFIPLALGLLFDKRWGKPVSLAVSCGLALGLLASMSSGPFFSITISLGLLALFRFRQKWPVFVVLLLVAILFIEVFSNRHFYYVMTRFAFDPETAYYRIGLIEECFGGGMNGHWLSGYGYVGVGPGNDTPGFNWEHQDLTNIYVHFLARAGLLALLPYLMVNILYYRRLYQAAQAATGLNETWLVWCFMAVMVGWNFAMMTVAPLAQIETLLYMFIALCANMPVIVRGAAAARQVAWEWEIHGELPSRLAGRPRGLGGPRERPALLKEKRQRVLDRGGVSLMRQVMSRTSYPPGFDLSPMESVHETPYELASSELTETEKRLE